MTISKTETLHLFFVRIPSPMHLRNIKDCKNLCDPVSKTFLLAILFEKPAGF
jgi:hypothetical protein